MRKFGPLADGTNERIDAAGPEDLDLWTDRVLTAATLEEVLG